LQDVLRRIYAIEGVSGTQATVVLETFFERPVDPRLTEEPEAP
ncbi:Lrp/AsnC family transcriptional regulator, partial [Streptomyces sp. NPDC055721]